MSQVIIVRIADSYQPEYGTPFDAVVSALNHFEIRATVSRTEGDELVSAARTLAVERAEFRRESEELAVALRAVMDTTPIRIAQAGLAKGIGTAHPDGIAIKVAEAVLAKVEAR